MLRRLPLYAITLPVAFFMVISCIGASWAQFPAPQVPAQPQPPAVPQQAVDPRIPQVRAAVERQGQRVLDVTANRHRDGYRIWIVYTTADYTQPSASKVIAHASAVWWAAWSVLSNEPRDTEMISAQVWSKYVIGLSVSSQVYAAFLAAYRAAATDAQRSAAFDELLKKAYVDVFDMETQRAVDAKDFINKNFAR